MNLISVVRTFNAAILCIHHGIRYTSHLAMTSCKTPRRFSTHPSSLGGGGGGGNGVARALCSVDITPSQLPGCVGDGHESQVRAQGGECSRRVGAIRHPNGMPTVVLRGRHIVGSKKSWVRAQQGLPFCGGEYSMSRAEFIGHYHLLTISSSCMRENFLVFDKHPKASEHSGGRIKPD